MMVKCPECHKDVSDSAEICPSCGYRLIGRENLVRCPGCKADVIPEFRPRDTISRYCPICKQPLTNLVVDSSGRPTYRLRVVNNQLISKTYEPTANFFSNGVSDVYQFMVSIKYFFN